MPSIGGPMDADSGRRRVDFILGDRHGTSCAPVIIDRVEEVLIGLGYEVARNSPYAGGLTTVHYGPPATGLHALQIEINRRLYMDEERITRLPSIEKLRADIGNMIGVLVGFGAAELEA